MVVHRALLEVGEQGEISLGGEREQLAAGRQRRVEVVGLAANFGPYYLPPDLLADGTLD